MLNFHESSNGSAGRLPFNSRATFFVAYYWVMWCSMCAGSPCVLATFFLSPLVGGGVMAVVFPIVSSRISPKWKI